MSLRKLSGAAAAGSRHSYATAGSVSSAAAGAESVGVGQSNAGGASSVAPSSKGYSSHLAVQSEATKYRGKYKELKKKVRQIEGENDRLHLKTLRIKRNIQRMRLERAILYERLEAELSLVQAVVPSAVAATVDDYSSQSPVSRAADVSGRSARRNIDFSPSPEEERGSVLKEQQKAQSNGAAPASTTTPVQPGRASMKITLKRSHNSFQKQNNV